MTLIPMNKNINCFKACDEHIVKAGQCHCINRTRVMKQKVSFDFDSTLTAQHVEDFAKSLLHKGIEVHITTSRFEVGKKKFISATHNDDLFKVADKLGIPKEHIHFTNMEDKAEHLDGFIWHLDDDWIELNLLEESECLCVGVTHIGNKKWKDDCRNLLGL